METFYIQFSTIAILHLLAVASPGPDFAIVLKQSLNKGKQEAIKSSIGIGTGILIHCSYSILGIGAILKNSESLFRIMQICCAAYLAYLGITALLPKPVKKDSTKIKSGVYGITNSFFIGLLTNVLNPKATLFFISLFTVILKPGTSINHKIIFSIYMAIATCIWFTFVSILFGNKKLKLRFIGFSHWIDKVMGIILLILSLHLVFSKI